MGPDKEKDSQKLNVPDKHQSFPEPIVSPSIGQAPVSGKKKMSTRRKIVIPLIAILFLYFSGILGFGYYWVKCGNPPALEGFAGSGYVYTGDFSYALLMPFTSLGSGYVCTDKSPFPWTRNSERTAAIVKEDAQHEEAKQAALNNIDFELYEVKNGTVPDIKKSGQALVSTEDGGRIIEDYTDTIAHKDFRVIQRKKTATIADDRICALTVKKQSIDPNYERQNNFCGEFTPKGLRVYSSDRLPASDSEANQTFDVVDMGDTQILINGSLFSDKPNANKPPFSLDKAKLYAFIDRLSPIDAKTKQELYKQTTLYR